MKRFFVYFLLFCTLSSQAQEITVSSFKQLETDLTANTAGTIVYDQNGEKCALIKVATPETGFSFDVGMLGVVKTIQKESEVWVYVPAGVKRISISHAGMDALRDWDLGMSVSKGCTYLLKIKTSKIVAFQEVIFKVFPENAVVMIESADPSSDFEKQPVTLSYGMATMKIPVGDYRYTAIAPGYTISEGMFTMTASSPRKVILELAAKEGAELPQPVVAQQPVKETPKVENVTSDSRTYTVNGIAFKMIYVQGGTFSMGATKDQLTDATDDEKPVHDVKVASFYIGETEVTQELWCAVMDYNPSFSKGGQRPVEKVSWDACQEFITRLNELTGASFRLPTEAEWEYAARGGNRSKGYKYSGGSVPGLVAWFDKISLSKTHAVRSKLPNELGIYDMSGNVWEWCSDVFCKYLSGGSVSDTKQYVFRGGSYCCSIQDCRVSRRTGFVSSHSGEDLGFRISL